MTRRLVAAAEFYWPHIDGGSPTLDIMDLRMDRFLNHVYHWLTKDADPAGVAAFDAKLWMPPKGVVALQGPWSVEAETSAFRMFSSQVKAPDVKAPVGEVVP